MTDVVISPNMNLPVPIVGVDAGPDWATNNNACLNAIDSHNHTSGQGVPITPDALDISSDLTFQGNNATNLKSARFTAQLTPLAGASDLGCVYVSGVDLYYNDENGNQIRITTGGNVNAGAGSITGLPSGTASVAFAAATYTFLSATNTGATLSAGPVAIGSTTASAKQTTLASNAAQAANIALVLPTTAPSVINSVMSSDSSGNMSWSASSGTGDVIRKTSATLSTPTINAPQLNSPVLDGAVFTSGPTGYVVGAAFTPTITWSKVSGSSVTFTTDSVVGFYQRIGNTVSVSCRINFTITGFAGGSPVYTSAATIPLATASLSAAISGQFVCSTIGSGTQQNYLTNSSNTGAISTSLIVGGNVSAVLAMTYSYLIS